MAGIVPPRQGKNPDLIASRTKILYDLSVVQVTTGERVQTSIDHQAYFQERTLRKDAQAISFSHIFTVTAVMLEA